MVIPSTAHFVAEHITRKFVLAAMPIQGMSRFARNADLASFQSHNHHHRAGTELSFSYYPLPLEFSSCYCPLVLFGLQCTG
jgi:hypothetical protein